MTDKILGRDDLLSGNHLKRELIEVPELDGSIWLKELSTPQLLLFRSTAESYSDERGHINVENDIKLMTLALSLSACDADGNLLFTEQDVIQLMNNKLNVLATLGAKVLELSGMDIDVNEVTANLKKVNQKSSSSTLRENSIKRRRK